MTEIAGFVAEYTETDSPLCYGFGTTKRRARLWATFQISGASAYMQALIRDKITLRPVSPDEASEIVEMLETEW